MAQIDPKPASPMTSLDSLSGLLAIAALVAVGAALAAFQRGWPAALGVVILILVSAFACGAFLGFLFGVPRVLSREGAGAATAPAPAGQAGAAGEPATTSPVSGEPERRRGPLMQSNTNLERISDWLTTMIVGATLVQLYKINDYLVGFRLFLTEHATVFGEGVNENAGVLPAVGPVVLIFAAATGFLFMYLNTRLILIRLFLQIEDHIQNGPEKLNSTQTAEVAAAASSNAGEFMKTQLARTNRLSIHEVLELMRSTLYKEGAHAEVIRMAAPLGGTAANNDPEYWFLLTAAFGQAYDAAKAAGEDAARQSARENALDAARRAISLSPAYRWKLRALTDATREDDDLAQLYADDAELRRLLRESS